MSPDEYAAMFSFDLAALDFTSERSRQDDDGVIGASSFACREQMRRIITQAPKTDSPSMWAAFVGSALDERIVQARSAANPKMLFKQSLPVELPNGFVLSVHPDEIDPDEPSVTDYKTKNGLAAIRRGFADPRHRYQRHLQYFAAWVNGVVPADGTVRNVFVDRSGADDEPHVEQEPFDMGIVEEASEFLSDALYAVEHGETASQDIPRYRCSMMCQWFTACRGGEITPDHTDDPDLTARIAALFEARKAQKDGKELEAALKAEGLEGLSIVTPSHELVSVWQNSANRTPHWKMTVRER